MSTPTRYLKVLQEVDKGMGPNRTANASATETSSSSENKEETPRSPEGPEGAQPGTVAAVDSLW